MSGEVRALEAPSVKGAAQELTAAAWLMRDGWYVFQNISRTGPVDLIAIKVRERGHWTASGWQDDPNAEDSEILLIDVKSSPVSPRPEQRALGVHTMYPSSGGYKFNDGATQDRVIIKYRHPKGGPTRFRA